MVEWSFPVFTALSVVLVGICGVHAGTDRRRLGMLASGVVYGVILEQLTIIGFDAYSYPVASYLVTVADVPIAIGLSWAAILYTGILTARRGGLSGIAVPLFVAVFALHIDLALDVVAIRVGYWEWAEPGGWFGVPLGNFVGWYWVAFSFAGWWELVDGRGRELLPTPAATVGGIAAASAGLIGMLYVYDWYLWPGLGQLVPFLAPIVLSLVVVARAGWRPHRASPLVVAVPVLLHLFFLGLAVWFGMGLRIVVLGLVMLGVGVGIHAPPGVFDRSAAVVDEGALGDD